MKFSLFRSIAITILSLSILTGVYFAVFRFITAEAHNALNSECPELEWLRREFAVSDTQFAEIRSKHETHEVVCRQLCVELAEAQGRLDQVISQSPVMNSEVESALSDWAAHRKRCRQGTLQHMYEVSSILDPESAKRYREQILRTLILPGRMPHHGENAVFQEQIIESAAATSENNSADD